MSKQELTGEMGVEDHHQGRRRHVEKRQRHKSLVRGIMKSLNTKDMIKDHQL